jgi:hypothetical protein
VICTIFAPPEESMTPSADRIAPAGDANPV